MASMTLHKSIQPFSNKNRQFALQKSHNQCISYTIDTTALQHRAAIKPANGNSTSSTLDYKLQQQSVTNKINNKRA